MNTHTSTRQRNTYTPLQVAAAAVGVAFLLVGVLGFVPGVTTEFDTFTFAGHHSRAALFGLFAVSGLHNIVHLLFGVAGLALARRFTGARAYLIAGGLIYLVLCIYGANIDHDSAANFVPVNNADNWLHFGLGVAMISFGVLMARYAARGPNIGSHHRGPAL